MLEHFRTVILIWMSIFIPFYGAVEYVKHTSSDSIDKSISTFVNSENINVAQNISNKIKINIQELETMSLCFLEKYQCLKDHPNPIRIKEQTTFEQKALQEKEDIKKLTNDIFNQYLELVDFTLYDEKGKLLYSHVNQDTSDMMRDEKFVKILNGKFFYNFLNLNEDKSNPVDNIGFKKTFVQEFKNKKYIFEIVNKLDHFANYITGKDISGTLPRYFYVSSPDFPRYIYMNDKSANVKNNFADGVNLGIHLTKVLETASQANQEVSMYSKVKISNFIFSVSCVPIEINNDNKDKYIGPKLYSFVACTPEAYDNMIDMIHQSTQDLIYFLLVTSCLLSMLIGIRYSQINAKGMLSKVIIDTTPVPVIVFKLADGKFNICNPHSTSLLMMNPEKTKDEIIWNFFTQENDKKYVYDAMESKIAISDYETILQTKSGQTFYALLYADPIYIDNELYVVFGIHDISHMKDIEKKLKKNAETLEEQVKERTKDLHGKALELENSNKSLEDAKKIADQANESKSIFLKNMSSELRTPLHAIMGYSEILKDEAIDREDEVSASDLQKIMGVSKHLMAIIVDILDVSKVESGKTLLYFTRSNITDIVSDVDGVAKPIIADKDNTLFVECEDDIGEIYTDATKLRQILLNIIGNASKFTDTGKITLNTKKTTIDGKEFINFVITDTGIGMPVEQVAYLNKVFKTSYLDEDFETLFDREDSLIGLGLTITKKSCEMLGGTIYIESTPNEGTISSIMIPVESSPPMDENVEMKNDNPFLDTTTGELKIITFRKKNTTKKKKKIITAEVSDVEEKIFLDEDDEQLDLSNIQIIDEENILHMPDEEEQFIEEYTYDDVELKKDTFKTQEEEKLSNVEKHHSELQKTNKKTDKDFDENPAIGNGENMENENNNNQNTINDPINSVDNTADNAGLNEQNNIEKSTFLHGALKIDENMTEVQKENVENLLNKDIEKQEEKIDELTSELNHDKAELKSENIELYKDEEEIENLRKILSTNEPLIHGFEMTMRNSEKTVLELQVKVKTKEIELHATHANNHSEHGHETFIIKRNKLETELYDLSEQLKIAEKQYGIDTHKCEYYTNLVDNAKTKLEDLISGKEQLLHTIEIEKQIINDEELQYKNAENNINDDQIGIQIIENQITTVSEPNNVQQNNAQNTIQNSVPQNIIQNNNVQNGAPHNNVQNAATQNIMQNNAYQNNQNQQNQEQLNQLSKKLNDVTKVNSNQVGFFDKIKNIFAKKTAAPVIHHIPQHPQQNMQQPAQQGVQMGAQQNNIMQEPAQTTAQPVINQVQQQQVPQQNTQTTHPTHMQNTANYNVVQKQESALDKLKNVFKNMIKK